MNSGSRSGTKSPCALHLSHFEHSCSGPTLVFAEIAVADETQERQKRRSDAEARKRCGQKDTPV